MRRTPQQATFLTLQAKLLVPPEQWRWHCRIDRGKDIIDEWYQRLSKKAHANFDRARDHLQVLPITSWSKPAPASYVQQDHIYVIRFKDEARKQWRVFGHADVPTCRFVMSIIATERDNVYDPLDAGDRAARFKELADSAFAQHARECFNSSSVNGDPNAERLH